jgi:hypothetical protein
MYQIKTRESRVFQTPKDQLSPGDEVFGSDWNVIPQASEFQRQIKPIPIFTLECPARQPRRSHSSTNSLHNPQRQTAQILLTMMTTLILVSLLSQSPRQKVF